MVRIKRLTADDARLLDPNAAEWRSLPGEPVTLAPTPLTSQPSLYVQATWENKPYGMTQQATVRAAHNGSSIFFHLTWGDPTEDSEIKDTDHFTDAAAVLFPVKGDAPLTSMGSADQPVNAWYWRADFEEPVSITAQGTGTTVRHLSAGLKAGASFGDGRWSVVISRAIGSPDGSAVTLRPGQIGQTAKVAFAVWQGSNRERGGLKAATLEWQPLEMDG